MGSRLILGFAILLIAGLVFVLFLGRLVVQDLNALSTAGHDDIRWNISQLEVETLKLERATRAAMDSETSDLRAFRNQFDIYYSRVATLTESQFFTAMADTGATREGLDAAQAFIDRATPIVDGPDDALRIALPDIQAQIEALRPQVRALGLAGIQVFAQADATRRAEFSKTLVRLAISTLALVLILIGAVVVLIKLFGRVEKVAHDNHIVRSRFEAAVSSSLDAVLVVDTSGTIVEFNGAAEEVFGYSRAEAIGAGMAELIVPEHLREMHRKGMARYLETNEKKVIDAGRVRLEGLRKSGEVFPVELSISLSEADGERVFVSFLRDITPELEAEEKLRSALEKAQESEKAKSNLLTVMSHEMRTPLNGILGSLALVDQDGLSERNKRHLNSISVSGELLLSHVNDVLDLSSLSANTIAQKRDSFDLSLMIQQIADSLSASAQARGNSLTVDLMSDDLGLVTGAKRSLQQCLINLVGNAIKFTRDGVVAIEVERLNATQTVEIRISDTGVGITPENLERIFEEFVTIDTSYARENVGTGLGLAITKRLVTAMDGEIEADSLIGEGSLFTLRLPLAAELPGVDADDTAQGAAPLHTGQNLRALVVDDNEINRMILVEMLQDMGVAAEQAEDGFAAVQCLSETPFDALFLDISMPGIDGIETLAQVRDLDVNWRNLPAFAVTAHAARKDHEAITQASFADILVKPVRPADIQAKLSTVLDTNVGHLWEDSGLSAGDYFKSQFGEAAYAEALHDLRSELAELVTSAEPLSALTPDIRAIAHKLAGTAAVLGEDIARLFLQDLEHLSNDEWTVRREASLNELNGIIEAKD